MWRWLADKRLWLGIACLVAVILLLNLPDQTAAEYGGVLQPTPSPTALFGEAQNADRAAESSLSLNGFWHTLMSVAPVMLLAALLGGVVAYRRRMATFEHNLFHAHILLSVAGALMMLIVGN